MQLEYAKKPGTRWKMPAKWYRFDLGPASSPLATVIALDSNLPKVSGGKDKIFGKPRGSLSESEAAQQHEWLVAKLQSKRAPFTIVTTACRSRLGAQSRARATSVRGSMRA